MTQPKRTRHKTQIGIIKWEEPPPSRQGRNIDRRGVVAELRKNPGKTARVQEKTGHSAASNWRQYGVKATSRKQDDGTYTIWAWWPTKEEQEQDNG